MPGGLVCPVIGPVKAEPALASAQAHRVSRTHRYGPKAPRWPRIFGGEKTADWQLEVQWWGVRGWGISEAPHGAGDVRATLHCGSRHLRSSPAGPGGDFVQPVQELCLRATSDEAIVFTLEVGRNLVACSGAFRLKDFHRAPSRPQPQGTAGAQNHPADDSAQARARPRMNRISNPVDGDVEEGVLLPASSDEDTSGSSSSERGVVREGPTATARARGYSQGLHPNRSQTRSRTSGMEAEALLPRSPWWSAFSAGLVRVLGTPLEQCPDYSGFQDFLTDVPLRLCSAADFKDKDPQLHLKVVLAAAPRQRKKASKQLESNRTSFPLLHLLTPNEPQEVYIRVYALQATDLWVDSVNSSECSQNASGTTFSSERSRGLEAARQEIAARKAYLVAALSGGAAVGGPEHAVEGGSRTWFGQVLELRGALPFDWRLTVSARRADDDSVIGETVVDVENRFTSAHRATVGLPREYCRYGWQRWREAEPPSAILAGLCAIAGIAAPSWSGSGCCVSVGSTTVTGPADSLTGDRREDAALHALLRWHHLVPGGRRLLQACVEMRPLPPSKAAILLWVDILPVQPPPPPALDISPPPARPLVLTVNVERLYDVELKQGKSDRGPLVARAWLGGCKSGAVCSPPVVDDQLSHLPVQLQLPLLYSPLERRLLAPHRRLRRLHRPRLHLQLHHLPQRVARTCLGRLSVDLSRLPRGVCSQQDGDLFASGPGAATAAGTWTLRGSPRGRVAGRVDMTLNLSPFRRNVTGHSELSSAFRVSSSPTLQSDTELGASPFQSVRCKTEVNSRKQNPFTFLDKCSEFFLKRPFFVISLICFLVLFVVFATILILSSNLRRTLPG